MPTVNLAYQVGKQTPLPFNSVSSDFLLNVKLKPCMHASVCGFVILSTGSRAVLAPEPFEKYRVGTGIDKTQTIPNPRLDHLSCAFSKSAGVSQIPYPTFNLSSISISTQSSKET